MPTRIANAAKTPVGPSRGRNGSSLGLTAALRLLAPTLVAGDSERTSRTYPRGSDTRSGFLARLPTLTAHDAKNAGPSQAGRKSPPLISLLPTLKARDADGNTLRDLETRHSPNLNVVVKLLPDSHGKLQEVFLGGQLNPTWCEWFMGAPIGWTGLEPLATESYRQWWRSSSTASE